MRATSKNRGFSLIEAMIALLVISVGLLGIASLQANGLKFNHIASMRSLASIEASNIMNMMRANLCGAHNTGAANAYPDCSVASDNAFSYAGFTSESTVPAGHTTIGDPGTGNYCQTAGTSCSSSQQAAADLWAFSRGVAISLPQGAARVSCNDDLVAIASGAAVAGQCTNESTYTVIIFWQEENLSRDAQGQSTGTQVTQQFATVFRP